MSHTDLVQRLIARSTELSAVTHAPVLVDDPDANALVTDLAGRPHAFVYACIADRQVKAELAWSLPHALQQPSRQSTRYTVELARPSRQPMRMGPSLRRRRSRSILRSTRAGTRVGERRGRLGAPAEPIPGEPRPEETVGWLRSSASALTGQHGELLPKGQVLEQQVVL